MTKYKLSELWTFRNGANYPKWSYWKWDKIVNVKDLFKWRFIKEDWLDELKPNALKDKSLYIVEDGDILFTRSSLVRSWAGMCAMVKDPQSTILFCGFIIRYRVNKNIVNPLYLLYLLRSPAYRRLFTWTQWTNITNINQDSLWWIEVNLPELETQDKLAKALSKIDDKVELNSNMNSELEMMMKELYEYRFVQFDFPDENWNPYKSSGWKMVWNEQLKREIPDGWEVKKVKDVFNSVWGYSFSSDDYVDDWKYKLYTIWNVQDRYIDSKVDSYLDYLPSNMPEECLLKPWEMLMSLTWNVGRVWFVYENNALLNQRVLKLESKEWHKAFMYMTFLQDSMRLTLERISTGTSQKNLSPINMWKLNIIVPSENILKKYDDICNPMIDKLVNNFIENQKLSELRDFLLPMLVNGQVTVK